MKTMKFSEFFKFKSKTKIKAGEGLDNGLYPFYTSSPVLSKRINESIFNDTALIFGTGGSASIHFSEEPFSVSADCLVAEINEENINPETKCNPKFAYYYFLENMHILEKGFKGAGLKHISKKYIENLDIPVTPYITQNKIVSVLDRIHSIVQKRRKSITLLEAITKSQFLEMFGDPVFNSKDWKVESLEKVLDKIESGWSPVCENQSRVDENDWAVLKQSAVSKRIFEASENKLLPKETKLEKQLTANKGDLLFSRKNAKKFVGAAAYVFDDNNKLLLPDTIFKLVAKEEKVLPLYLLYLFNDGNFKIKIQNLRSGAASSMPNISKSKLWKLQIPIPPLNLQADFDNIIRSVHNKKLKLVNSLTTIEELFYSVLQKSFNGQQNFDITAEVDALLQSINLKSTNNNFSSITRDLTYIENFVNRINESDFDNQELYEKAKFVAFQLLKNNEFISQEYDEKRQKLRLVLK